MQSMDGHFEMLNKKQLSSWIKKFKQVEIF